MLNTNRLCRCLPLILWGFSAILAPHAYGQIGLEFCDDFCKPVCQQRDPFEERIETERHDFTQSATTVGRGVVQIEGGYSYFYKDKEHEIESAHTTPEMLVRVGISEDIEFRLRWNYAWVSIDEEPGRVGSEDIRYSVKLQMTRQPCAGLLPTSALELRGTAPTGGDDFSTGHAEFSLDYICEWELTERVTFAGSTGFGTNGFADFGLASEDPTDRNFNVLSQSAVLGLELSELNVLYIEWFGIFSSGLEDDFVVSVFNVGLDHYITDDFVVDFRAGVGLTEDSDDFFTGVGGAYRF